MALTRVVPSMFAVANGEIVSGVTVGNTTSIAALTFDESGVIVAASNVTVTVANTNITGLIKSDQIANVASDKIIGSLGGNYVIQTFTSPGTWTKPEGLKAIRVSVGGGGGGGGGASPNNNYAGNPTKQAGPGGGGGVGFNVFPAPSIPGPVSVTIGSGGTPGPAGNSGGAGGTSSFGAFISATGGTGGGGAAGPATGSSSGSPGVAGTSTGELIATYSTFPTGFSHLPNFGAVGVEGTSIVNTPGGTGTGRISAGGGAWNFAGPNGGRTGGAGAGGIVIVEEFY